MFISKCNLCNYADKRKWNLKQIKENLEMDFMNLHKWFHENHMALNSEKCHYTVIGIKDPPHKILLNNKEITSSNKEKLYAIPLDSKLNFESHISSLCRKASQKINVRARLKNYLTLDQRNLLLHSVIKSQLTYCPVTWMFTSRYLKNTLNNIHKRALRLTNNDHEKSFNSILTKNNPKTIHQKNLEFLAIQIYKFQNGLSPPTKNDVSTPKQDIYNLRKFQELSTSA